VHHLNDETGKMSKSKGDFLTVSLLKSKGYDPLAYRLFCLQSHYRKPLTFSYDALDQAQATYRKLKKRVLSLSAMGDPDMSKVDEWHQKFADEVGMDLNTSMAVTYVYDVLKADLDDATKRAIIDDFDKVLSLDLTKADEASDAPEDNELAAYVEEMINKRKEAKKAKDFATADAIRDELLAKGIVIKDTREGTVWERA
jgi:cysteinyl-tRNA synthetase